MPELAVETADWAAERLETTVEQVSGGGGGGRGGGGGDSTAQLSAAGLGSTLPAPSRARTENWWVPTARPE